MTLNGGETWSPWYNQPTAQLYHIAADANFPYRVAAGSRKPDPPVSRRAATTARFRSATGCLWAWMNTATLGGLDPTSCTAGECHAIRLPDRADLDRRAGRRTRKRGWHERADLPSSSHAPSGLFRSGRAAAPFGNNYLWKTTDGGMTWTRISDDLTRKSHDAPRVSGRYASEGSRSSSTTARA